LKIIVRNNSIIVNGLTGANNINIYSITGTHIKSIQTSAESINIPIQGKGVYIVRVGTKSVKVIF
jgi:hypothetical protein